MTWGQPTSSCAARPGAWPDSSTYCSTASVLCVALEATRRVSSDSYLVQFMRHVLRPIPSPLRAVQATRSASLDIRIERDPRGTEPSTTDGDAHELTDQQWDYDQTKRHEPNTSP